MTDARLEVLELDADGRPARVGYQLRYVTRILEVGMILEATAPSERGRRITIDGFARDGELVLVVRNTSRRRQAITTRGVVRRYAPTDRLGLRRARWRPPHEVRG